MSGSEAMLPHTCAAFRLGVRCLTDINPAWHRSVLGKGRTLGTPRGSWQHSESRWSWGQAWDWPGH